MPKPQIDDRQKVMKKLSIRSDRKSISTKHKNSLPIPELKSDSVFLDMDLTFENIPKFPDIDNLDIPLVREIGIKNCIRKLGHFFNCEAYNENYLQFWFLDVITDCIWMCQDRFNFPNFITKNVLSWVLYAFDLIRDREKNLSKAEFMKIFRETLYVAADLIDEGCYEIPVPIRLVTILSNDQILSDDSEISRKESDISSKSESKDSSRNDYTSYVEIHGDNQVIMHQMEHEPCICSQEPSTPSFSLKSDVSSNEEIQIRKDYEFNDLYKKDSNTPSRFKSEPEIIKPSSVRNMSISPNVSIVLPDQFGGGDAHSYINQYNKSQENSKFLLEIEGSSKKINFKDADKKSEILVTIVTGASSGIGASTAIHFASLGASLVLTGRNLENLKNIEEKCLEALPKIPDIQKPLLVTGELTKDEDVKNIIEKTISHFGKLDILVNNAGILETGSIENTSVDQYDRLFNTNVRSIYHLTSLAVPHLIKTKGNIVNVSSVNGIRAFAGVLAYCMSKSAVDQFTRCTALELASKQVRVNSVNPGVVITDIHKRGGMSEEDYAKFIERSKTTHALGRPGEAIEVAKTIAFLASEDASFITGANLPVDGGRHAMCPQKAYVIFRRPSWKSDSSIDIGSEKPSVTATKKKRRVNLSRKLRGSRRKKTKSRLFSRESSKSRLESKTSITSQSTIPSSKNQSTYLDKGESLDYLIKNRKIMDGLKLYKMWEQRKLDFTDSNVGLESWQMGKLQLEEKEGQKDDVEKDDEDDEVIDDLLDEELVEILKKQDINALNQKEFLSFGVLWAIIDFIYSYFSDPFQYLLIKTALTSEIPILTQKFDDKLWTPKDLKENLTVYVKDLHDKYKRFPIKKPKPKKEKSPKKSKQEKSENEKIKKEKPVKVLENSQKLTKEQKAALKHEENLKKKQEAEEAKKKLEEFENANFIFPLQNAGLRDEFFKTKFKNFKKIKIKPKLTKIKNKN